MKLTKRGRLTLLIAIPCTLLLLAASGGYVFLRSIGVYGQSHPGRKVSIEIPAGAGGQDIGNLLADRGVIPSALGWRITVYLEGGADEIQAGKYLIPTGLSPRDALRYLKDHPPIQEFVKVTFPEGSWVTDFARIVARDTSIPQSDFLELATSGDIRSSLEPTDVDSLEGLLFPSTYQVVAKDDARSILERLVHTFEDQVAGLDFSSVTSSSFSEYDAVIVASMIEAEAKVDADRGKIARVIYNRLREGMALQIDATVSYALGAHKTSLTSSDLDVQSPYNTYVVAGLPPTPIGAPGLESLKAAAAPTDGPWLYYVVSDCEGHHAFSESYSEFLRNKAAYQALQC